MEINSIDNLQQFLRTNWKKISDEHFIEIISNVFGVGIVFYRQNDVEDEIEYMNTWLKNDEMNSYGQPMGDFNIKSIFEIDNQDKRNLLFKDYEKI
jgi:hypothetical protein